MTTVRPDLTISPPRFSAAQDHSDSRSAPIPAPPIASRLWGEADIGIADRPLRYASGHPALAPSAMPGGASFLLIARVFVSIT